jgi:hypothetical protein
MKRLLFVALLCAVAAGAFAQTDEGLPTQTGGFGIGKALADSLYCALNGCTMTGALTSSSSGVIFNGTTVKAGGANILNIGNGANAQSLRVYNTDDGAGNAEYGTVRLGVGFKHSDDRHSQDRHRHAAKHRHQRLADDDSGCRIE